VKLGVFTPCDALFKQTVCLAKRLGLSRAILTEPPVDAWWT
jgi:hypothetical protein